MAINHTPLIRALALYAWAMQSSTDRLFAAADTALRTLFATPHAGGPCPTLPGAPTALTDTEKQRSAGLMRVNHVGEVCAQALYTAQALATRNPALRAHYTAACVEETDHLAWTAQRLQELGSRPSLLNPLWYAGAFGLGLLAGRLGDAVSLGFVVETETQVGAHLQGHLQALPAGDHASRAIVAQMRDDELRHADAARSSGAAVLPRPVQALMRGAAKVMTTVAQRV
jgi:ubiquinone biosynthesis monooxygenase Coq7